MRRAATGWLALIVIAGGCMTAPAREGALTPLSGRLTDETIARDLARIDQVEADLSALPEARDEDGEYALAKARAWLAVARTEYTDNDDTELPNLAFTEARRLVEALRSRNVAGERGRAVPSESERVRSDLWARAEALKRHEWFSCAARLVGELEVRLVWASNEERTYGARDPRSHEEVAESMAAQAEAAADACIPPPPPPPEPEPAPEPEPEPEPAPPEPVLLRLPDRVHFSEDSDTLQAATRSVLDALADRLAEYDVRVTLRGSVEFFGERDANEAIARQRVERVIAYLVSRGVDRSRFLRGPLIEPVNPLIDLDNRVRRAAWPALDRARARRVELDYATSLAHVTIREAEQTGDLSYRR